MKINVVTIPDEGLNFVFAQGKDWLKTCLPEGATADFEVQKADVDCLITKTSDTVFIRGKINATININCSRCLEETNLPLTADFTYTLMPDNPEFREEVELQTEDLEISYYHGDFIDLTPIICEQIILQMPIKALCREECKGLCPQCGANLNYDQCECPRGCTDGRMAALKDFKIKI